MEEFFFLILQLFKYYFHFPKKLNAKFYNVTSDFWVASLRSLGLLLLFSPWAAEYFALILS